MKTKDAHILLVEDNEIDIKEVQRSFKQAKIVNPVHIARDGIEALEMLRAGEIPSPYIILMDINMPRMDGIECMKEIRSDEKLRRAIIFMMSTSKAEEDKIRAYDLNAAGYLVKSDLGNGFMKGIEMLDHYWKVIQLPPE